MNRTPEKIATVLAAVILLPHCVLAQSTIKVAANGSGQYKTIQEAIAAVPDSSSATTTILLGAGEYRGNVIVPKSKSNLTLKGEGAEKTILTWDRSVFDPKPEGATQFNPGLWVEADNFRAEDLTIQNTAGDRGQALAAEIDGDEDVFKNCRITGWQDTLMANNGRQYYDNCFIEGRVDFIYGSATAVFNNCEIHSKNGGFVTAASTPAEHPFGFVFLHCKLTGSGEPWVDPSTGTSKGAPGRTADLGRPWRGTANVAFINCKIGDHISAAGWNNWGNVQNETTARFSEYGSKTLDGKPLDVSRRVKWAKQLTDKDAAQYTVANILGSGWDLWDPSNAAGRSTTATKLTARTAHILGNNAKFENGGRNVGYWAATDTKVSWETDLAPGKYRVGLIYALDPGAAGSELQMQVGAKKFPVKLKATSGWDDYQIMPVGEIEISRAEHDTVLLDPTTKAGNFIANLSGVIFKKM